MIVFSSDSTLIALDINCGLDIETGRWYYRRSPAVRTIPRGSNMKFVPGTYTLAFSTDEDGIYLWHVYEGVCEQWSLPHKVIALGFGYSDTWIAILGEDCLYLYDVEKRTLIQSVGIPFSYQTKQMCASRDGRKVVIGTEKEVLVLDIRALLAQTSPLTPPSMILYHMSDDRGLIARHIDDKLEVWDTATGTRISQLQLLPLGSTGFQLLKFSPNGQNLVFTYDWSTDRQIYVWNLSDNLLRCYKSPHLINTCLAVSDNGGEEGYWLAAAEGFCVSVWGITTGEHKKLIDLTDGFSKTVGQIAFTGSRLGVLFRGLRDPHSCGWEFSLLDTRTGEQIYKVMSLRPVDFLCGVVLRLSPNGTSGMFYEYGDHLSIWDSKGNIGCVKFSTPYPACFFRNEETLYTQQGHFSIHSVPAETTESKVYGRDVRSRHTQEDLLPDSTILEFEGYAYGNSIRKYWIHLDGVPLLWLPVQYRPDQGKMACGHDYVVVHGSSGVYSIRFKDNARDFI